MGEALKKEQSGLMSRRKAVQIIGGATLIAAVPFPISAAQQISDEHDEKKIYYAYRSFWPELEMTSTFKKMGVNTRCFFASNTINGIGFEYCKYPLIWLGIKKYDFTAYDKQVDDLLSANPEAKFLCMIDLNTPYWLTRRFAYDSFAEISHAASDKEWIKITTEWMLDFIAYSEKKYGDKISAYILSGGGTSEWYEYDRGRISRVKNNAWRDWCKKNGLSLGDDVPDESTLKLAAHEDVIYDPETEMSKIQYWRFHNEVIADAVLHFAKTARPVISKDKEIGVFFGYYHVSDNKLVSFGHLDYERVFASPDIDFFISPGTYKDRMIGGGSGSQLVNGTVSRYGKRYLHEIDHRTHCVTTETWKTQEDDNAGNTREAAFALINHTSLWWFDMWGGWYQKEETQQLIRRLKTVSDRYVNDKSASVAEVLLVADPQSAYYINEKMPHASAMSYQFRDKLNRTGTPFDVYSFNDFPVIDLSRYKVILLPATLLITPEREQILKKYVLTGNRTIVWTYAPGICDGKIIDTSRVKFWSGVDYKTPGPVTVDMKGWKSVYAYDFITMTPSVLKEIIKKAGVHMYTQEENPVYANERLLAVHFKEGGKKKISLPRSFRKVVDVISEKVVAEKTSGFLCEFSTPDTKIFELIK
ncbi:MAG: hypothetical protein LLG13_04640 [Bacteroidales bacterium]|nr:hypothetical protein [Bacteroidales bacterium]